MSILRSILLRLKWFRRRRNNGFAFKIDRKLPFTKWALCTILPPLAPIRVCAIGLGLFWLLNAAVNAGTLARSQAQGIPPTGTIPPVAPVLVNGDFECTTGYYTGTNSISQTILIPNSWQVTILEGAPKIFSARINFAKSCDGSAHVERITGIDSIVTLAQDLEKPPEPGKPFDVAFYQTISATVGGDYSLSGWLLSLCGGSATPTDCPKDYYIAKMLGIDPMGGTDANAATVIWTENRRNFVEEGQRVGWQQMTVSAVAQAPTITVFARIKSPFRWHGNHAFIDTLDLVRAPVVTLTLPTVITGAQVTLQWEGRQSPDIAAIAGGTYQLRYDLQFRHSGVESGVESDRESDVESWRDLLLDQEGPGMQAIEVACTDTVYEFRIRTRSEQPPPPAPAGVWPNQRYASTWSAAFPVQFQSGLSTTPGDPGDPPGPFRLYLPQVANQKPC